MAEAEHRTRRVQAGASLVACLARFVYHLARDPRVPWRAKAAILALGAYIVSPYDLIPDWIPVAGVLDDLLLIPIVMNYAFATVPEEVLVEHWGEDIEVLRGMAARVRRPRGKGLHEGDQPASSSTANAA